MNEAGAIDVAALIDAEPIGARQWAIIALCAGVALLDGMDVQSIGLAAAGIGAELNIAPTSFGAVFSSALAGLALGALFLGPLADRVGRKRVLIGSTLMFGLFTLATASSQFFSQLLAYRFLTGIGLGGAMPSFIALASEYVPSPRRAAIVSLVWAGFPLGGVVSGLLGAHLIPTYGWHSIFWVGGLLPIALAVALAVLMPESVAWLINNRRGEQRIASVMTWIFPRHNFGAVREFLYSKAADRSTSVSELFSEGRGPGTILFWIAFFFVFMILVTNSAWTPLLLKSQDIPVQQSSLAMAVYNFGSIFGSAGAGYLMTRFRPKIVLAVSIIGGAVAYAAVGLIAPMFSGVFIAEALFGLLMGCGSSGLIGLGAVYYPSTIRSTGVGWATAAGRLGSFCGPLLIGFFVTATFSPPAIFAIIAGGACISGLACMILRLPGSKTDPLGTPALAD
ncbi:MFS transporter [Rhizobium sp. AC27/96]|uniref:MFS transporter n=1 Tax=Rhizobium sp. AC27/96 TaxID=1841653 RepID=UPI0013010E13|nr:MFS transporter [Rhizobium sp. AC27/96]